MAVGSRLDAVNTLFIKPVVGEILQKVGAVAVVNQGTENINKFASGHAVANNNRAHWRRRAG